MPTTPETLPPQANPDLVGHEAAEAVLRAAALSGRLPHAWLIGGPSGVGKATLAYRFARFVLSRGAGQGAPSGAGLFVDPASPAFRRVAAGGHADLLTIGRAEAAEGRAARDISTAEVRRIAPFLRLTAGEDGWRVVIVDEAEAMNRNGANALLKILEEPPARAVLLLVCNQPGALLPTIRSRCRRLLLRPVPDEEVAGLLARARPDLPEGDRRALAALAAGRPGRALRLADDDALLSMRTLTGLLAPLPDLDMIEVHQLGDRLSGPSAERSYATFVDLLGWWLGRIVRYAATGTMPPGTGADDARTVRRLAGAGGLDRWLEVWDKTRHLFDRADSANLDRKQTLLQAFLFLAAAARA